MDQSVKSRSLRSYGFRPDRNAHQAMAHTQKLVRGGFDRVVDCDLEAFFDNVNHDLLMNQLKSHHPEDILQLRGRKRRAYRCLGKVAKRASWLIAHWPFGCVSAVG